MNFATTTASIVVVALCFATLSRNAASAKESSSSSSGSFLRGGRGGGGATRDLVEEMIRDRSRIGISSSSSSSGLVLSAVGVTDDSDAPPCSVHVTLTCPAEEPIAIDNDCVDPFRVMSFRYNGGDCSQSENLQARQGFTCTDNPTSPPLSAVEGTEHYILATSRSGNETYFSGPVAVGDEYTWNANEEFSVLSGETTVTVFDSEGGTALQTIQLMMDCSNPLFLFDRFGSSQVTAWKETTGRVVSSVIDTTRTGTVGITINNRDSKTPIRLKQMTLLANTQDEPVHYTDEIENAALQPEGELALVPGFRFEYDLATRTRYTFFTTVIAEPLDGGGEGSTTTTECNNHAQLECIF